ncbi:MAG TPA: HlyD family efflux transporter periplasmic adaptor subunit, partial [Verrucomicrobia bacterium]|nr:HlyD family efflux transporter periplasmic adaptor subunit [Verrucomicrobiota bacterium]
MKKQGVILMAAVLVASVAGFSVRGFFSGNNHENHDQKSAGEPAPNVAFYTCSMHPQIHEIDPGKCSLCGMDLIPVVTGQGQEDGPRELTLSARAMKLAEVQSAPVERKYVTAQIRMVGKVAYDETKLSYITARVPGRLDRLYVDYTGVSVNVGDHLVYLYSPELLQAQEELISAIATSSDLTESKSQYLKDRIVDNIESAREKLRLWGLSNGQIKEIEDRGKPNDHITINSPVSGIVVHKNAVEGMYVQVGTQVYTIADLTEVWVKLDAYESDLPWLHYGQKVEFRTEAYPGEVFNGQIAFIDPILNSKTRTIKIRVNLPNPDGKLKPDMFVRAVVNSNVARGGKVMDPGLAGKWISPMHPEIIKDEPGLCDICDMALVSAESLGYVSADSIAKEAPLVIPASAPLITGRRAVVYVEKGEGKFEGREVELGPRAGDYYLVRSGLEEGERVVVNGNFKIDSAIQILAKPSMMNPEGGGATPGHSHGGAPTSPEAGSHEGHGPPPTGGEAFTVSEPFKDQLGGLVSVYLDLQKALSHDSYQQAKEGAIILKA